MNDKNDSREYEKYLDYAREHVASQVGMQLDSWTKDQVRLEAAAEITAQLGYSPSSIWKEARERQHGSIDHRQQKQLDEWDARYNGRIQALLKNDMLGLGQRAVERMIIKVAKGRVALAARSKAMKAEKDRQNTCPVCGEVNPAGHRRRTVNEIHNGAHKIEINSCWPCFMEAQRQYLDAVQSATRSEAIAAFLAPFVTTREVA